MNATLQHHIGKCEESNPEFVKLMLNSFYCNNLSISVNTVQEAVDVCTKSKRIYKEGHFNLQKWNSKKVMKELTSYGDNVKKGTLLLWKHWNKKMNHLQNYPKANSTSLKDQSSKKY